jgi:hypothetical protein
MDNSCYLSLVKWKMRVCPKGSQEEVYKLLQDSGPDVLGTGQLPRDPSLAEEGKGKLFEERGEASLQGVKVGISYPDSLVTGLGSGDDLYTVEGNI